MLAALLALPALAGSTAGAAGRASGTSDPAEARARRDEIRREQARIAAEVEPLKATDDELAKALAVLNNNVKAQQGRTDDAVRAADDAKRRAEDLANQRETLGHEIDAIKAKLKDQAVAAYVNPSGRGNQSDLLLTSDNISSAEMQKALLDSVTGNSQDLVDDLRYKRNQLEDIQREADAASVEAADRRAEAETELGELKKAQDAQARIKAAYDERIAGYEGEARQLAAEDAEMEKVIVEAEAQARARAEANARANAALGGAPPPDAAGQIAVAPSPGGCIWPLPGGRVSQEYGGQGGHPGIDIFAPLNTPIYAAMEGEVIYATMNNGGYGNLVLLDHGGGVVTAYAHQNQIAVSVGQHLQQGQLVGYEGTTGYSTGPHLHFEVRLNGRTTNPRSCLGG